MQQNKKSPQYLIASIKDSSEKGIVMGYLANFNSLDSDQEIIMPGAFTKSIREMGPASPKPRIKYLLDHNTTQVLGVFTMLKEDTTGLYYEAQVGSHALGQDFIKMVASGLITEHSIGYQAIKKTVLNPDANWQDQQTQLHELKLMEGTALQCWGANCNTPMLGMKGMKYAEKRIPKLIAAVKNGTFTDESFVLLEKELLFLQSIISDYGTTQPEPEPDPQDTTEPNEDEMCSQISLMRAQLAMAF